jgi:hypothetical protein
MSRSSDQGWRWFISLRVICVILFILVGVFLVVMTLWWREDRHPLIGPFDRYFVCTSVLEASIAVFDYVFNGL